MEAVPLTQEQREFVEKHIVSVRRIAKRMFDARKLVYNRDEFFEDMLSNGYVGLVNCARAFDKTKITSERSESAYVYRKIHGAIVDGMRAESAQCGWSRSGKNTVNVIGGLHAVSIDADTRLFGDLTLNNAVTTVDRELSRTEHAEVARKLFRWLRRAITKPKRKLEFDVLFGWIVDGEPEPTPQESMQRLGLTNERQLWNTVHQVVKSLVAGLLLADGGIPEELRAYFAAVRANARVDGYEVKCDLRRKNRGNALNDEEKRARRRIKNQQYYERRQARREESRQLQEAQ